MPGEFFFMALGGLGVSLAGFVGIITALDRSEDARSVISMWRVRNIVWAGFTLTIIGFGIVAIYTATGNNVGLTIRITSLFVIAINGVRLLTEFRPGPAWPDRNGWRMAVLLESVGIVGFGVAAITAHVGLFQLFLVYQLGFPLSIFFFTIRDTAGGGPNQIDRRRQRLDPGHDEPRSRGYDQGVSGRARGSPSTVMSTRSL